MNTITLLNRNSLPDKFELTAVLIVMTSLAVYTQPVLAHQKSLPNYCDANTLLAFPEMPGSLKCTPAPEPYVLDADGNKASIAPAIIKDKAKAIALGKMLFWDSQVGSDGLACASCHFQAGADNRIKNQINPGMRNASGEKASDSITPLGNLFNFMSSHSNTVYIDPLLAQSIIGKGPNYTLTQADFPLRKYEEPETLVEGQPLQANRNAEVLYDSDDVISSQGVYQSVYTSLNARGKKEICQKNLSNLGSGLPLFNVGGHSVRQVEPRNTPTIINAVYNFRNFWDGRANNIFNGLDPFGMRRFANPDNMPSTDIYSKNAKGVLIKNQLAIYNASLASQAVGPALSDFEMSCGGKSFVELGKKMLALKPLSYQTVAPSDSVLGAYSRPERGLKSSYTYKNIIQSTFNNAYWDDTKKINGYTLTENNFSLFWGLAIQAYEATLVSDDSRFDQAQEDVINGRDLLTEQEQNGLNVFVNQGKCIGCHSGTEFTAASVNHASNVNNVPAIGKYTERMVMGDGGVALYDAGFYNIGVRPSKEDLGIGGTDPYGFALSFTRNAKLKANDPYDYNLENANISSLGPDPFQTNSFLFAASIDPVTSDERDAIDGAFKVPALRNVELTGPYFHNGGQATLQQVVQFYNRGGDRKDLFQKDPECGGALLIDGQVAADPETGLIDSSGFLRDGSWLGQPSNIAADMAGTKELLDTTCHQGQSPHETLNLSSTDVEDVVAFLKTLTDERVRLEQAPFDHPSLKLPHGHTGNENKVKFIKSTNQAQQQTYEVPAIGAEGRGVKGLLPLQSFEAGLQ
ncbi:cytochrome-c peroxidase [Crenothrix sp.]|uniref:cytochrome-c peroxidase n=1 Tax=Crenothrix sp. TaxID=3100433 RepID=UPI00374CD84A